MKKNEINVKNNDNKKGKKQSKTKQNKNKAKQNLNPNFTNKQNVLDSFLITQQLEKWLIIPDRF